MSAGMTNKGFQGDGNVQTRKGDPVSVENNDGADDEVDLSCGIWKLRTNLFGTRFANVYVFSVISGLSKCFTVMDMMILPLQLIYIQRQFNMTTAQFGMFLTVQKIGYLITALFAGQFCRGRNIPVIVGVSGLIQGICLMVPAFLQFADPYQLEQITTGSVMSPNAKFLCYDKSLLIPPMNGSMVGVPNGYYKGIPPTGIPDGNFKGRPHGNISDMLHGTAGTPRGPNPGGSNPWISGLPNPWSHQDPKPQNPNRSHPRMPSGSTPRMPPHGNPKMPHGNPKMPHENRKMPPKKPEMSHFSSISASTAVAIIITAQLVRGMSEPFHSGSLPNVYLDDNVFDKSKMSFLIGTTTFITTMAIPIGLQFNGFITDIPVDLNTDNLMTTRDARYVSAWWLPFLIFGVCTFVSSIPIMLFPKKLISKRMQDQAMKKAAMVFAGAHVKEEGNGQPGRGGKGRHMPGAEMGKFAKKGSEPGRHPAGHPRPKELTDVSMDPEMRRPSLQFQALEGPTERRASMVADIVYAQPANPTGELQGLDHIKAMIRDFPKAMLRILKIPIFALILFDIIIVSIPGNGISMLKQVYVNQEYNVPMSEVATARAISTAVASCLGIVIGSIVTSKVTTRMGYIYIMAATHLFGLLVSPVYLIFGCDNQPVNGLNNSYGSPTNISGLCDCSEVLPQVSCGSDGQQYLSPCHAGCSSVDGNVFNNCSLLAPDAPNMSLTPGPCPTDCYTKFLLYVILNGVADFVERLAFVPRNLLILRLTDPRDRALATSTFFIFMQLMGVWSPNLFGSIIDGMCIVKWRNQCPLYDRDLIRYLICGTECGTALFVMISQVIIIIFAKREVKKVNKELEMKREQEENAFPVTKM